MCRKLWIPWHRASSQIYYWIQTFLTFSNLQRFRIRKINQTGKYEADQTFHSANILVALPPPPPTPEAIMPSSRRSQNLSLEDSLIPSSISSRLKKPSGKAKADAARKAKADAAARTIVDAAVKANCPRNFKEYIVDNFKAAKKERQFSLIAAHRSVWCRHAVPSFHFSVSFSESWISWTYEHVYLTPFIETTPSLSAWLMTVTPGM